MNNKASDILLGAATLSLTVFFFLPASIYWLNRENILASDYVMIRALLFVSGCAFIVLTGALLALRGQLRIYGLSVIAIMATAVWAQANVFNWDYGHLDGETLAWRLFHWRSVADIAMWLFVAAFVLYWGMIRRRSLRNVFWALLFIQCSNLVYVSVQTQSQDLGHDRRIDASAAAHGNEFAFSKDKNIFILVYDAYQTDVFYESLLNDEDLKDDLQGFVYYPDAVGGYPYTVLSVPLILSSQYYVNQMPRSTFISDVCQDTSIIRALHKKGYQVGVHSFYENPRGLYRPFIRGLESENSGLDIISSGDDATQVKDILYISLFRIVPHIAKNTVHKRFLLDPGAIQDRDIFLDRLHRYATATIEQPVYRLYHLQGLHVPWVVDGQLLERTRENALQVANIINDVTRSFLEKLKTLGIYDNSAIFIVADHGLGGIPIFPPTLLCNSADEKDVIQDFVKSKALALLLHKDFHADGPMEVSLNPVSQANIAPTILEKIKSEALSLCEAPSLFDVSPGLSNQIRRFYSYEYYEDRPEGYWQPLYEYLISDFSWLKRSWIYSGNVYTHEGIQRMPLYACPIGSRLTFGRLGAGIQYLCANWRSLDSHHVMTGDTAEIRLLLGDAGKPSRMEMVLTAPHIRADSVKPRVAIHASDTVLGVFDLDAHTEVQLDIPAALILGDQLVLRLSVSGLPSDRPEDSPGLVSLTLWE